MPASLRCRRRARHRPRTTAGWVALAKHYRNVAIDLCWAWIVNPAACVRFVKEFLLGAPSNKLLTFGGDYATVENVVGHAAIARQGLAQALGELVEEGWLRDADAPDLVEPLMRRNARELFPTPRPAPVDAVVGERG